MAAHIHDVTIYYEDTDFSGVVYHANYLKFMERGRSHALGIEQLVERWRTSGTGFMVYKAELTFREPARYGDHLQVHTTFERQSRYRVIADQRIRRQGGTKDMVVGRIDLVAVNAEGKLCDLPPDLEPLLVRFAPEQGASR